MSRRSLRKVRVHRVHVSPLVQGEVVLRGTEAKHLAQVLRVAPGSKVRAFDGAGLEAEGEVVEASAFGVTLRLNAPTRSSTESALAVTLAVGLLKGDKLSGVVRQSTELGVVAFQLFSSEHGDVPSLSSNKLERLRRVAQEAAKQSGRSLVPTVAAPIPLAVLDPGSHCLVAHPGASMTLAELTLDAPHTLITGPEGGLSEAEVAQLQAKGAQTVRLGPRILRAETAPVALVAALLLPTGL